MTQDEWRKGKKKKKMLTVCIHTLYDALARILVLIDFKLYNIVWKKGGIRRQKINAKR